MASPFEDDGERRYLHFGRRLVQSAMRLDAPNALEVFDQQVIVFPVKEDDNHILLAFLDRIEQSARRGLARREALRGG